MTGSVKINHKKYLRILREYLSKFHLVSQYKYCHNNI